MRAPVQQRSKDMLERLLRATIVTIGEFGLDGATIPRIAKEAKIAPASVYRRFQDKDALFQAAFLKALESGGVAGSSRFDRNTFSEMPLEEAVSLIVNALFRQYRAAPRFLKAFVQFYENHADATFRTQALGKLRSNLQVVVEALSSCPELVAQPNSEFAAKFGVLAVATSIEAMVLSPETLWTAIQPITEEATKAEFVRLFLSYLRSDRRGA